MIANYHTHTFRCHHASGTEREYVQNAVDRGLKTLGFSDHCPYFFEDGYYSTHRMLPEELEDYIQTIRDLQKEFAGKIRLLIGLEVEYYPKFFSKLKDFLDGYPLDYLILGQHFLGNEMDKQHASRESDDEARLAWYTDQTAEALQTGLFSCFAHPDMFRFTGDGDVYRKYAEKQIQNCMNLQIPMEVNLLGASEGRHYPRKDYFSLVGAMGASVVVGCDAHDPDRVAKPEEIAWAEDYARRLKLNVQETMALKRPR